MQCPKYGFTINEALKKSYCKNCDENCANANQIPPSVFQKDTVTKGNKIGDVPPSQPHDYKPKMFDCPWCITEGIKGSLWYNEIDKIYECLKCKVKGETLNDIELQIQVISRPRENILASEENATHEVLANPLLLTLKMFLADVMSWHHQYIEGRYVCSDFSQEVVQRATERGIRCGYVIISFEKSPIGHAIVAFETDYGLIYIEPQSGEEADVKIGKHYSQIADGVSELDCIRSIEIIWNDGTVTNF